MKKIYTAIFVMQLFACAVLAQSSKMKSVPVKNIAPASAMKSKIQIPATTASKTSTLIWSDDFSSPGNWSATNDVGNSDDWVVGTTGPTGPYAIADITSTSAANGFALFDSDLLCSGDQIANLTTVNPINLTGHSNVRLEFQQFYRRYYDSTYVYVSNDNVNWDLYSINQSVAVNGYSGGSAAVNPDLESVDISATAGGQATVYIRFTFYSPSSLNANAGCCYAWMIDDVTISDQLSDDVSLSNAVATFYSRTPLSQVTPITFTGDIKNEGVNAQTNVALNIDVNAGAYVFNSAAIPSLASGATNSVFTTAAFTPSANGVYSSIFNVTQTQTDLLPDNNSDTIVFEVNNDVFSRDNDNYTVAGLYNGVGNDYFMGNRFDMPNDFKAGSINFVLQETSEPGAVLRVVLFSVDTATFAFTPVDSSADYTVQASDLPSGAVVNPVSVTLVLQNSSTIWPAGIYMAAIIFNDASIHLLAIASGSDIAQPPLTSFLYDVLNTSWFYLTSTPMIRLNLITTSGIENQENSTSLSFYPNPVADFMNLEVKNVNSKTATLKIYNQLGAVVATETYSNLSGDFQKKVDVSKLSNGIYSVNFESDNKIVSKKITIAH